MSRRLTFLGVVIPVTIAIATSGCVTTNPQGPATPDPIASSTSQPADPQASGDPAAGSISKVGVSVGRRAQSAVEGLVLGAAIGAQAGPIGAAVGAGTFLIYGALTGHSPLGGQQGGGGYGGYGSVTSEERREAALEEQIAQEAARSEVLEDELAEELRRQEELLQQIESDDVLSAVDDSPEAPPVPSTEVEASADSQAPAALQSETSAPPERASDEDLAERADPRVAPSAPKDRRLPMAIFEKEEITVPAGVWGNKKKMKVVKRSLDADQNGSPEQIRYYDESGEIIRKEQDQNYDGQIDTWNTYRQGSVRERVIDTNGDGELDVWETYENGKMVAREVDRDDDGVRDAFYTFRSGSLVEERHDADNDGNTDLLVTYENRIRVRLEEDRDKNGQMDLWITYRAVNGAEAIARIEKDERGDGKPDVFETFSEKDGKPVLAKREEDKNGDGNVDVTSIYENGKLVRREITDPNMVPL